LLVGRSGSAAVNFACSVVSSTIVSSVGGVSTGARFTSWTKTVNVSVSLSGGEPLSVTVTAITLVLGPWASVGVHVSTPVDASSITPGGAEARLKVSVSAGTSGSIALFVTVSVVSSLTVWSGGVIKMGAPFTSFTATVKLPKSLNGGEPSSVTSTVIRLVLGRWSAAGVQVRTPLIGSRLT